MDLPKPEMIEPMLRGSRARVLLADPVFSEAVVRMRDQLTRDWAKSGLDEREKREALYHQLQGLNAVMRGLESFVTDATVEHIRREKVG